MKKRKFIFSSQGHNTETRKEEWILFEDIEEPWYKFTFTKTIKYNKIYNSEDIIDFLKLFTVNKDVTIEFR